MPGLVRDLDWLERLAERDGSEIWRARWIDGSPVVVKILTSSRPDRVTRFETEARLLRLAGGRHGLVECIRVIDNPRALVLEYLDGGSLHDRIIDRVAGLPVSVGCGIVAAVADAAAWLHSNDIIHRDIKPSNILLGHGGEVRLIDLGVAAFGCPPRGMPDGFVEEAVGTLGFAAPELLGDPSSASIAVDIYGLGATLYEALTGYLPHGYGASESIESYQARIAGGERAVPVSARAEIPATLAATIDAALSVAPGDRPGSVSEFAGRIRCFA